MSFEALCHLDFCKFELEFDRVYGSEEIESRVVERAACECALMTYTYRHGDGQHASQQMTI